MDTTGWRFKIGDPVRKTKGTLQTLRHLGIIS